MPKVKTEKITDLGYSQPHVEKPSQVSEQNEALDLNIFNLTTSLAELKQKLEPILNRITEIKDPPVFHQKDIDGFEQKLVAFADNLKKKNFKLSEINNDLQLLIKAIEI